MHPTFPWTGCRLRFRLRVGCVSGRLWKCRICHHSLVWLFGAVAGSVSRLVSSPLSIRCSGLWLCTVCFVFGVALATRCLVWRPPGIVFSRLVGAATSSQQHCSITPTPQGFICKL